MTKLQKIFWKAIHIIVRAITLTALITLSVFSVVLGFAYTQGFPTEIPLAVCIPCLAWLALIGLLFLLEKKFGI